MLTCLQPSFGSFAPRMPVLRRATLNDVRSHYEAKGLEIRVVGYGFIEARKNEDDQWRRLDDLFFQGFLIDDDGIMFYSSGDLGQNNSAYRKSWPTVRRL